jgi:hypothetical protein
MGVGEKLLVGAGAGLDSIYRGVRGLLPPGLLPKDLMGGTGEEDAKRYQQASKGDLAMGIGEILPDLALSAIPVARGAQLATKTAQLLRMGRAAPVVGDVAANALYSAATSPGDRTQAAEFGGLGALAGRAVPAVVSRAMRPAVAGPEAQKLIEAGVQPTFGQVLSERTGPLARAVARLEEAATSVPFAGAPIRNARTNAVEGFQRASREAALPPGAALAAAASVDELGDAFNKAYNSNLQGSTFVKGRDPFVSFDLDGAIEQAAHGRIVTGPARGKATAAVGSILDAMDPTIYHSPVGGHELERRLKDMAYKYKSSPDPEAREYGDMLYDVAMKWKDEWRGSLPQAQREALGAIDKQFAQFVPVRRAAGTGNLAAPDAYTPKVLLRAIRAGDKTQTKRNFIAGGLPQQDLATAADKVLGNRVADSGTAERAMVGSALGGGSLLVGMGPQAALTGTALALYGTAPVQRYLTSNTAVQKWLTENLSKMSPQQQEQAMRAIASAAAQAGRASATSATQGGR